MKLSLPVIAQKLDYKFLAPLSSDASLKMRFSRPVFHTSETTLKADTLYIAYGFKLPGHLSLEPGCGLICLGSPDKTSSRQRLKNLLILSRYEDIFKVYNSINSIFDFYENWEEKLTRTLGVTDFKKGLLTMADVSAPLFSHKLLTDFEKGTITLEDPNSDLSRGEISLLNFLSEYVERYKHKATYSEKGENDLKGLLKNSLESGFINEEAYKKPLEEKGWKASDQYTLALLSSAEEYDVAVVENLISRFSGEFSGIPVFVSGDDLMGVVNLSALKTSKEETMEKLDFFLSENSLYMGLSNTFTDFYQVINYKKEAQTALRLGKKASPQKHIFWFSDYVKDYIREKILEDFPAKELFPTLYYKLKDYDEANKTDYLHTLEVYLDYDMNAVQASNALYIHRATIIYRLKKICEIGQTDLKDKNELLYLELILNILPYDTSKEEEENSTPEEPIAKDLEIQSDGAEKP